jgi:hypothetical protein
MPLDRTRHDEAGDSDHNPAKSRAKPIAAFPRHLVKAEHQPRPSVKARNPPRAPEMTCQ